MKWNTNRHYAPSEKVLESAFLTAKLIITVKRRQKELLHHHFFMVSVAIIMVRFFQRSQPATKVCINMHLEAHKAIFPTRVLFMLWLLGNLEAV